MQIGTLLYRLGRGDYFYTIAEMAGLGVSTVCTIVDDVTQAIVNNLWSDCVTEHMPKTEDDFRKKIRYGTYVATPLLLGSNRWASHTYQMSARWATILQRVSQF